MDELRCQTYDFIDELIRPINWTRQPMKDAIIYFDEVNDKVIMVDNLSPCNHIH